MALDQADRLLRPGSRLLVLADPLSVAAVPESRWPTLAQHREVVVLLLSDPLERDPPKKALPFFSAGHRLELDLAANAPRERWEQTFVRPIQHALAVLGRSGIHTQVLSSEADSAAWLPMFGAARPG
jgi:hypothetical protein